MHIKEYMVKMGISNTEMAEKIGISQTWLSRIRTGRDKPSHILIRHIEEVTKGHVKESDWQGHKIGIEETRAMKIEVQEFYPLKNMPRRGKIGTLHVYIEDLDMDIRGVSVIVTPKGYFIQPPSMFSQDKERVKYPCVSFLNADKQKAFMQEMIKQGVKFMKEWEKSK